MIRIEKSIVIEAPVEAVFAYFSEPERAPEYLPGADEVKDVQRLPDGRYKYTLVTKFLGLHIDIASEQVEIVPNERIVEKGRGAGLDGVTTIRVERMEGGNTRASVVNENIFHAGPLDRFGETFLAKYFAHGEEVALEAAKAQIEARARSATTPS